MNKQELIRSLITNLIFKKLSGMGPTPVQLEYQAENKEMDVVFVNLNLG